MRIIILKTGFHRIGRKKDGPRKIIMLMIIVIIIMIVIIIIVVLIVNSICRKRKAKRKKEIKKEYEGNVKGNENRKEGRRMKLGNGEKEERMQKNKRIGKKIVLKIKRT